MRPWGGRVVPDRRAGSRWLARVRAAALPQPLQYLPTRKIHPESIANELTIADGSPYNLSMEGEQPLALPTRQTSAGAARRRGETSLRRSPPPHLLADVAAEIGTPPMLRIVHSRAPLALRDEGMPSSVRTLIAVVLSTFVGAAAVEAGDLSGEQIYQQQCASCHGGQGEGVKDAYGKPLIGDRSVPELTDLISKTMPEGEPEKCVGEDAARVAQYIYDSFYSEIAQARNRPPKIEFSRLTVRQYEHSVADLFRSFRGWADNKPERGLKAEYFNSRGFNRDKRVIERIDGVVDFDFGEESPEKDKIGKDEFAIKWQGSLIAPETGVYDFILKTDNGVKLWINDDETPLIDAWVRSGDGMEYRGSLRLLGGRTYPLRLEYFKFKDPRAAIELKWKPPYGVEQIIPQRNLTPGNCSSTFVVSTPFPPDDRSTGFIRGTSVSPEWNEATTFAAIEAAAYVDSHLRELVELRRDDSERSKKIREFCVQLAERAFRRPLTDDERKLYVELPFETAPDEDAAIKRVVLLVLKSPRFLYREIGQGDFDDYDTAAWLSFALWDSVPDRQLLEAAQKGQLKTKEQLQRQAERMLADPRSRAKVREFLHTWLQLEHRHEMVKDRGLYPEFSDELIADLRTSLDQFLDDVVWSDASDYRRLLTADSLPLNERIAKFYGVEAPQEGEFVSVSLDPDSRAGLLSHPYLLSAFAYDKASSPIHRGVWLSRNVLGRVLSPPPIAVAPVPPELHAGLTTRERTDLQTGDVMCSRCHGMINSLGFALEHFDAVGRFRNTENDKPVDAAGSYVTRTGETVQFNGVKELARYLAESPEAHQAFAERLFQHLVKQPIQAFGPDRREQIARDFEASGCNIRKLIVEMAVESTLGVRERPATTVASSTP
jgi:mono/diheme cytochrome c family protein